MLTLISAVFSFLAQASDPNSSCSVVHRDPYVAGTFYLYCSTMSPDGVELVTVHGRFISDKKAALAKAPQH